MDYTIETIGKVPLSQLIEEIENYKKQVDEGRKSIYLITLEKIDMLYLIRNHPEKDKLPPDLFTFFEKRMIDNEMDSLRRYSCDPVGDCLYNAKRQICLAAFYVEKEVFTDFWRKHMILLRPIELAEVHKAQTMETIEKVTIEELQEAVRTYLDCEYPFPKLSLRDIFYLSQNHKDKDKLNPEDIGWIISQATLKPVQAMVEEVSDESQRNEYHLKAREAMITLLGYDKDTHWQ